MKRSSRPPARHPVRRGPDETARDGHDVRFCVHEPSRDSRPRIDDVVGAIPVPIRLGNSVERARGDEREKRKMYGLIFENFSGYLKHKYGEDAWDQIRRLANLDSPTFSIHQASLPLSQFTFGTIPQ